MEKRMRTSYLAYPAAAIAMCIAFSSVALAGVGQEKIPELQRETRTDVDSATFTGCVVRDTAVDSYKLTNVTKEGSLITEVSTRVSVRLSTIDVDLAKHVGHRVSVTGLYSPRGQAAGAISLQPAVSGVEGNGENRALPTLKVKSLTMVADSCSEPATLP
jgi:hypothetical protein